jgi:hypothetical protein
MDSSIAVVPLAPSKRSVRSSAARSLTAALLIACIGVNTAAATGLARSGPATQDVVVPAHLALPSDLATTEALIDSIDALDEGEIAELESIYAGTGLDSTAGSNAVDTQKSWKTALAKAILKSSAFKAALRRVSERAYIWYMGHVNQVVSAMDGVTRWETAAIAGALAAVGVPPTYANFIARVLSFFL